MRTACIFLLTLIVGLVGCTTNKNTNVYYDGYATKVYLSDSVEISFYSPKMFRFRTSKLEGDKFDSKYEIPFLNGHFEPWEKVECSFQETQRSYKISTSEIQLDVDKKTLEWKINDSQGNKIYPSNGKIIGMFKDGYSKFDNASAFNEFNLNSRYTHWFYNKTTKSYTDTFIKDSLVKDDYFIYGPDYKSVFKQFNELVGPEPLLPKKGYGFFQTQHLSCSGDQDEFMQVAHLFREKDIPCDNLILDFGWGDACIGDKEITWGSSLDWSENYIYPLSAKQMIDSLKQMDLDLMLIHHNAPAHPNRINHGWTETLFDEDIWWKRYKEKLDMGIAGTWQDTRRNNITDAEIWNGTQEHIGRDQRVLFLGCRRMQETNPWDDGVTQLPVNAMIGQRRYPFRWVGDSDFTWSEMKWQINAITNTHGSMKGMSHLTWDVYGKTPLIQARMNQFVDFLGVSRSHNLKPWSVSSDINQWKERIVIERSLVKSSNQENAERMAKDGEYTAEKSIRRHRKLRYRLLPYIYSLAYQNYLEAIPMCRPMVLQYPEDGECNANQWPYQYMFGSSLLVAPVYHSESIHTIYLPEGKSWFDYWSKQKFEGGQVIKYDSSDPDKLPLLVPEGGTLCYGKEKNWINPGEQDEVLWLEIYPGSNGESTIYEDDGQSIGYQQGEFAKTKIHWEIEQNSGALKIQIGKSMGDFKSKIASRVWKIRVLDAENRYHSAIFDGNVLPFETPSAIDKTKLADNSQFKEVTIKASLNQETEIKFQ